MSVWWMYHSWGTHRRSTVDWIVFFYSLRNLFKIMLSPLLFLSTEDRKRGNFLKCTHRNRTHICKYLYSCIWYGEWRHFVYIVMAMESVTRCKTSGTSGSMDWTVLEWAVRWNFHNFECWDTDRGRPKLT